MSDPVNAAGIPLATASLRREAMAVSQVSRPSGVRTISTCGAPAAAVPSFSSRSRSRPAAGAPGAGTPPLVPHLAAPHVKPRPPWLPRGARPARAGRARAALRRRGRLPLLTRIRVPGQALPLVPGLPAPLAVLAPLPLRLLPLPGLSPLFSPDPLPRRRRPRVRAVHRQAALQLSHPQLKPPPALPRAVQRFLQRHGLLRPVRQQATQPRVRSTQPGSIIRHRLIGHAPQAPTATTPNQIDSRP